MMYLTIYESNIPLIIADWYKKGIDVKSTNVPNIFECVTFVTYMLYKKVKDQAEKGISELNFQMTMVKFDKPKEIEFFSIEGNPKTIHIEGYTYYGDNWAYADVCGFIVPLDEFVQNMKDDPDYVADLESECKQYQEEKTDKEVLDIINTYFGGLPADRILSFEEITNDTPCGNYVAILNECAVDHFKNAVEYVNEYRTFDEVEINYAVRHIEMEKAPLYTICPSVYDEINDLMEEYSAENDLPEGWWFEYGDAEDVFDKLLDLMNE